jgi:hypothetical protein
MIAENVNQKNKPKQHVTLVADLLLCTGRTKSEVQSAAVILSQMAFVASTIWGDW